jgi:hypothetical protein
MVSEIIPCKDCIVLAMCKSRALFYNNDKILIGIMIEELLDNCQIFKNWWELEWIPEKSDMLKKVFMTNKMGDNMNIPCKDCICLPVCKSQSYEYDPNKYIINPIILRKCKELRYFSRPLLKKIAIFLRPDLK